MGKGIPHQLMKARCKYCGRNLRYAHLPNRGPVMVHTSGEGEACRRMQAMGNDLVSREEKRLADETARKERLAAFKNRKRDD